MKGLSFLKTVHSKKYFPLLLMLDRVNKNKNLRFMFCKWKFSNFSGTWPDSQMVLHSQTLACQKQESRIQWNRKQSAANGIRISLLEADCRRNRKSTIKALNSCNLAEMPRSTTNKLPKIELILVYIPERTEVHLLLWNQSIALDTQPNNMH